MKIQDLAQFPPSKKFVIIYNSERSKFALVEQVQDKFHVSWTNGQRPMLFHSLPKLVEWFSGCRPGMSKYVSFGTVDEVVRFTFRAN